MRRTVVIAGVLILLGGCAHGVSGTPTPAGPFTATIAYEGSFGWPGGPGAPLPQVQPTPLVMYDQQFFDPNASSFLLALLTAPSSSAGVTWTSSNPSVASLQTTEPFAGSLPGDPAPTAPPGDTFAQIGRTYGTSTITADAGSPVNKSVAILAYHYASLSFGCQFRFEPVFAFDPDRVSLMQQSSNWTSADLFDTFPSNELGPLDPCLNSPLATAPSTSELWHVPYGGVILPMPSLQQFTAVTTAQWRNAGTQFPPPQQPAMLLLKTKEGRFVKLLMPIGPLEVSEPNGPFPF